MKGATGREMLGQELPGATWRNALGRSYGACTGGADPTRNPGRRIFLADDVVTGDLKEPTPADCMDLGMDYEDWTAADNHAYLTMRRNCEKEPHTLIRLCKTSYDAYKTLVVHYENKMISDLGIVLSNVVDGQRRRPYRSGSFSNSST